MELDHDTCYRAVAGRDRRFDGVFFTAVRTTGIYCRPSCPARTPRPANVTFHRTAASAQAAGFRACNESRKASAAAAASCCSGTLAGGGAPEASSTRPAGGSQHHAVWDNP